MSRGAASALLVAAILGLGALWWGLKHEISPPELGSPHLQPGTPVLLTVARVDELDATGAILTNHPDHWRVEGTAEWSVGEEWSVGGVWDGEKIAMEWARQHPQRSGKKMLGLAGIGLVVMGALWGLRPRRTGIELRG